MKNGKILPNGYEVNRALWTKKTNANGMASLAMHNLNLCSLPQVAAYSFLKYASAVLLFLMLGIGNAWAGGSSYYTGFKATGGATGKGYVYASTSNTATPVYETEVTAESQSDDLGENGTKEYYAWAKAVRGSEFSGWSISGDKGNVTPTSGTNSPITVTVTSAKDNTNTGTATATWTTYAKVNVTYNPSEEGVYSVTYQYDSYNETTKEITTGDAENLSRTISSENGVQTIGSYKNDVITLKSTSGTFQGWYSDAGFTSQLSTDNPYTYTAPTSGSAAVYPKYEHVDKYYGRLTASIAEVPYSMPGGGTIFISKEEAGTGTYSADAQTVDNIGMGTTGLKYYLHAQPNDKRYVFRGWYSDAACTSLISTNADYTYTFTATSMNSANPTLGNVYAAFDFNLYYMQVEAEPAVPGLGMVFVKDDNSTTPVYTEYTTHSEQFLYAYRLASTANAYLYAKPKYGYKFSGWYDNPDCTGAAKSTANPYTFAATGTSTDPMNPTITTLYAKFVVDDAKVNIPYNIPDKTKGEYTASVLDIAEVEDEFVWTFKQVYNSADYTANTTLSQNKTDVLQLEAQPKAGYGVTSWTIAGTAKTTPSHLYETTATAAATYGVTFGDAKPFLVSAANATTGTQYATLAEALANLGSNKKITVVQNAYVPAGNYTIPSGVTLLVPHDETYAIKEGTTDLEKTYVKPSAYVTLTLGGGARLIVKGNISVSAKMASVGNNAQNGGVCGKYGAIIMETSGSQVSNITLNSGAHLYCWGYIYGDGRVEALSGAEVYEGFVFVDWRGGSNTSSMADNSQRVFPFNQYYIQNIEVPLTINKGAVEKVFSSVYASKSHNSLSISMIGESSGLFRLTGTGSKLTKWYDPMNDRQHFELEGAASISDLSFKVYGINVSSTDYVLPINNNMDIVIKEGASVNITEDVCVMPDATITIEKNATMAIANGANVYVYDKRAYTNAGTYQTSRGSYPPAGTGLYAQGAYIRLIGYSPSWAAIESVRVKRALKTMKSAQFNINGTLAVTGKLYTTEGGADLRSDADGAKITFSSATGTATITYQVDHSGYDEYYYSIPITPAKLHNGNGSYVVTIGSVSEDKFFYSKQQEKWLKNPKVVSWNANGGTTEASTMAYSEGAFVGELPAAYKDGYTLEGWFTAADGGIKIDATTKVTANITYYAHWTPKSYTITYRDNGGTAFSGTHKDTPNAHPTTHTFGTATALTGATKEHYTFGGWYRTPSCSGAVVTSIAASECKNITLYAKWTINTHKLTWNMDGGATSSTTYTAEGDAVAYNTTIVYPADNTLTKANFVFKGWDKSISTMPDEDLTITARWTPAEASVTVGGNTTYHATVADAIAVANGKTNAVVTILQNASVTAQVNVTAAMTINLNGKKISSTQTTANTAVFKINASGKTVTIKDSGTNGEINHTASVSGYMYGLNLYAGSLNIESGTIYAKNNAANRAYGIYTEGTASSITISGSAVVKAESSTSPFGLYSSVSNSLTMNGGTFIASGSTSRGIYVKGTTNLTNATITVTGSSKAYAIFAVSGTMIINSGTYTTTGGTDNLCIFHRNNAITINGGRFRTSNKLYQRDDSETSYTGTITLQGGYYNNDTELEAKCATNYHVLPLEGEDPYKYEVTEAYTITFKNGDVVLQSGVVKKGSTPLYSGETPTKEADAQYTYTFNGWSQDIAAVTADATYTAQFSSTPRSYAVTLNVNDGSINAGAVEKYIYGTGATLPTDVTKVGHKFDGWFGNEELTGDAVTSISNTATGNKTYWAKWTKLHAITWMTTGNVTLRTDYVADGEMPSYGQTDPTQESTEQYTFAFEGWYPAVVVATKDASYTAQFQNHTRYYTITWKNYNGTVLKTDQNMQYGDPVSYDGDTPTKSGDVQHFYAFKGWYPEVTPDTKVAGDQEYVAQFGVALTVGVGENTEYEVSGDEEVVATTVQVAGHLKVPAEASLTTDDLILEATPSTSGEITGAERVKVKGHAYFDLTLNTWARHWHAFGVPWKVGSLFDTKLVEIKTKNGEACRNELVLGRDYDIIHYNGATRAAQGPGRHCWDYVEFGDGTLDPGKAYMIGFIKPIGTVRFTKASEGNDITTDEELVLTDYAGTEANHGWNAIANPKTYHAMLDAGVTFCQVQNGDTVKSTRYTAYPLANYKFVVGTAVYVQVSENRSAGFNNATVSNVIGAPLSAPRRVNAQSEATEYFEVHLLADGKSSDRIYIKSDAGKEEDVYTTGIDVAKMGVSDMYPQLWIERYSNQLAVNTIAPVNDVATYPLSLFAPKADEYTVSTNATAEDNVTLYLTFDGRPIWNLTYSPYVTSLEKGTNRHYGLMLIRSKAPEVATGIGDVQDGTQPAAQKILLDGQVYILRGDELYSITGQNIK